MHLTHGDYVLSDDKTRLDIEAIAALLVNTYCAADRPRSVMEKAIEHSICFGLFHHGRQVGFARVVTDRATFSWVCDVVIHPDHRGKGLGKWMMKSLLAHPELQTVSHVLRTKDAHGLYERFGFQPAEYMRKSSKPL